MNQCAVCKGEGTVRVKRKIQNPYTPIVTRIETCNFCSGTGEYSRAAESFMVKHICNCAVNDRRNCDICGKRCHHSSDQNNRLLVGGGTA